MIEHSVPQNVTSYQFHLIGNMTIKQFLMLLAGAGLAVLVYTTNLPGILKWPLILVFVIIGVAMAFVPYEERSLDQWLVNFVRAMYRPTKFFWRRLGPTPEVFLYTPRNASDDGPARPQVTASARRKRVSQYLSTIHTSQTEGEVDPLDMLGRSIGDLDALFDSVQAPKTIVPSEEVQSKPNLRVRSRPLGEHTTPALTPAGNEPALINVDKAPDNFTIESAEVPKAPVEAVHHQPVIETVEQLTVPTVEKRQPSTFTATTPIVPATPQISTGSFQAASAPAAHLAHTEGVIPVVFNRNLPFPSLPDKPNMLIGMVYNSEGSILANAILEIINEQGNTVRALKTNSLGQFYTSTSLPAGNYIIETEYDGLTFPRYQLVTEANVLDPIEIRPSA